MRSFRIPAVLLALTLLSSVSQAREEKLYVDVHKMDGTIMVDRAKDQKKEALQTREVVERGDVVTVFEKSWVILRSPKGDLIGLEGPTKVTFEELYKGGSDRQIRMNLHYGRTYLRSRKAGSRQSYFEVSAGGCMVQLQKCKLLVSFEPKKSILEVQFHEGNDKTMVVDSVGEKLFPFRECKRVWENGKTSQEDPAPLDEKEILAFKDFFKGTLPAVR
jgi:hypothetical protein